MATYPGERENSAGERRRDPPGLPDGSEGENIRNPAARKRSDISPGPWSDLLPRLYLVRRAGRRPDRLARHPAVPGIPRGAPGRRRDRGLARSADAALAASDGWRARRGVDRRLRVLRARDFRSLPPRLGIEDRPRAAPPPGGMPPPVALALLGGAGFSLLPVGHSALRGRLSRAFCRRFAGAHLALPLAALPPDVLQRRRQADERRPHVAQSHRDALPLRNAAAAQSALLVRLAAAAVGGQSGDDLHLRGRTRRPVSLLRPAPRPPRRRVSHRRAADPDSGDRQFRLFQFPRHRPLLVAPHRTLGPARTLH